MIRRVALCLLAGLLAVGGPGYTQDEPADDPVNQPVEIVAFVVEGRDGLNTASISDAVDDSITRLQEQFRVLGATTRNITLDEPIPAEVELVVLIRPRIPLSVEQTAYLWAHLQNGGHLLLGLDPNGHNGIRAEPGRGGLNRLLDLEYGLSLNDDLLIADWFSVPVLADLVTSWSNAVPEPFIPHPITDPILAYDLPLRIWGARSMSVAGLTATADTNALMITEDQYGETGRINFRAEDSSALQLNIGNDNQGRLVLGAIATNAATGSRVALIGDSEFFQNIYGQTRSPEDQTEPRFLGNVIFTERLSAWLMGLPAETWPALPDAYTWIALDGNADDWPAGIPAYADDEAETGLLANYDIQQMQILHNDRYAYLVIQTRGVWDMNAQMTLEFTTEDGSQTLIVARDGVSLGEGERIADADATVSPNIELRLPLRVVGAEPVLESVCIENQLIDVADCLEQTIRSQSVPTQDPAPMRFTGSPSAFTLDVSNLRDEPTTDAVIVTAFTGRTQLDVVGRDETGDWIRVRDGRYEGWMASFLLVVNADVETLPMVDG